MAGPETEELEPSFPASNADAEPHPGADKSIKLDPVSAQVATSLELKEQMEAAERERDREERKKKDEFQTLKKIIIVSSIIAVVAGAVFAVAKKMKEKQ